MINAQQHKEETARKLEFLRNCKEWSQEQISKKIKIKRSTYAYYELGKNIVPHLVIKAICSAYGITLNDFDNIEIPVTQYHKTEKQA